MSLNGRLQHVKCVYLIAWLLCCLSHYYGAVMQGNLIEFCPLSCVLRCLYHFQLVGFVYICESGSEFVGFCPQVLVY